ncbi:bile acid:sodium symporter family protein [Lignipirellula cremea]|uniref:Sodium Bile acid symporter family protein n=1 Tax=Lignipirellula cremea TaxID=2528010 RepID=A0A518E2F3_9BACT|nr:bile acid:sodium symporter [Lignipirellula cremea]QDU98271.1 Sodium Bile acid symporter family protein [Lignipirellula cremea]
MESPSDEPALRPAIWSRGVDFLIQRWFLIGLACVLALGVTQSARLEPLLAAGWFRNLVVFCVLFCMALPLEASAMWLAMRRPSAPLLGIAVNFVLLPLFAWVISWGLDSVMAAGLIVAASAPCTLASAVVWTRKAEGNDSVAILITMLTNSACFLVTPFWVKSLTGEAANIDALELMQKLGLLVVLPITVAQLLRIYRPLAAAATRNKTPLSVAAQCGLLTMVLIGAINIGVRLKSDASDFGLQQVLMMVVAVQVVHVTMLFVGYLLARLAGMPRDAQIAVAVAGSQKTLMVGLMVGVQTGITILPMVVYHVSQLLIDTFVVDWWRKRGQQLQQASQRETPAADRAP